MSTSDLSLLDRMAQRFKTEERGLVLQTLDGETVLHKHVFTGAGSGPVPAEVSAVAEAVRTNIALGTITAVAGGITQIWSGTQAQYDAIATKDDDTLYIIVAG